MSTTSVSRLVHAPRSAVYRALIDPDDVARWRVPDGMRCEVHQLDATTGGTFRVSLTYDEPSAVGKTSEHTDTYHGRFVELVPDERVVEMIEFETDDPAMQGEMTMTTTLVDVNGATEVTVLHEGLPAIVSVAGNEEGTRMALANLAALVESRRAEG